jgi:hypothetical protein
MDIHKPKPVHSWREFFSEISVVVVGIAIALAAEQAIEGLHKQTERAALRHDLKTESRQILADARKCEVQTDNDLRWLNIRILQVQDTVWRGRPLAPRRPVNEPTCASPDIPIWRSAKAGGQTALLSKGELNAFAEVEYVQAHLDAQYDKAKATEHAVKGFNAQIPPLADGNFEFSQLSKDDLRKYLSLISDAKVQIGEYRTWLRVLSGAESAILAGKTELSDIYASERKTSVGEIEPDAM